MSDSPDTSNEQGEESEAPSTEGDLPEGGSAKGDTFTNCPRCNMRVRSSELSVHLAHAHNIGGPKDRKPRRGGRPSRGRD